MPSQIQVTDVKALDGSSGISIADNTGRVTFTETNPTLTLGSNATGFTGAKEVDFWKLNADNTDASGVVLNSTLERVPSTYFEKIGTGMTKNSGNFSFPLTGKYLIQVIAGFYSTSGSISYGGVEMNVTTNNSSYNYITNSYQAASATGHYGNVTTFYFLNVTDKDNVKVQFKKYVSDTSYKLRGATGNFVQTAMLFIRLGDT
mgnify:CR=1 FL=1